MTKQRTTDMEDWCGSKVDSATTITMLRVYNGIMVEIRENNGLVCLREVLVFSNVTHLVDWIQHWYECTSHGAPK